MSGDTPVVVDSAGDDQTRWTWTKGKTIIRFIAGNKKNTVILAFLKTVDRPHLLGRNRISEKYHREHEEGPAYQRFVDNKLCEMYFKENGEYHRPTHLGPAKITPEEKIYYLDGVRQFPAVI